MGRVRAEAYGPPALCTVYLQERNSLTMARPKHPDRELEAILREAEGREWRVEKPSTYFRLRCPCPGRHQRWVHLTPSDPNYGKNLRHWLGRLDCWREQA